MTPPVPGINTPGGEKIVFQKIKQTSSSINALHSLEIRDHFKKGKIKGEADFCVIYPNHGVFIIEVKGGEWEINNGQWYGKRGNTVQSQPLHESPFQQAEGNYYSISRKIIKQFPEMKKKLFGWGVVLPHASFPGKLFELDNEEWRVWDATNINDSFEHYLKLLATKEKQRLEEKGRKVLIPTEEDCEKIKEFLRPDYECPKLVKLEVDNANRKIEQYTQDQFDVLDQMIDNSRLVIKGGAGTGKTLIAAEAVRRNIQDNKQVLFLCKNREITDTVRDNLLDEGYFDLYKNYPTIKTWDSFIEHELLFGGTYLDQLKRKYSKIGDYFNDLPGIYLNRCTSLIRKINKNKDIFGEKSIIKYSGWSSYFLQREEGNEEFSENDIKESKYALAEIENALKFNFGDKEAGEKLKDKPYNLEDMWKNCIDLIKKNKNKLLDIIKIDVTGNCITISKNYENFEFERYYFSENLQECYNSNLDFLGYLKTTVSNEYFSDEEESNLSANFEISGDVYFSNKDNNRPISWHFHNEIDKKNSLVYLSDDEISRFKHEIFSLNKINPTKKQNPYRFDFYKSGFLKRIQNEINYYKSENIKDFFTNNSMHDLYASAHPSKKYDILIIDESQDIVKITNFKDGGKQNNLNILHHSVKNGLFEGSWNFYLDPMQYSSKFGIGGGIGAYNKVKQLLDKINPTYTRLTSNCRNTKEISKAMFNLCDVDKSAKELDFSYNINEKVESGVGVSFLYYNDVKEVPSLLNKACKPLHAEGVKGKDIQILSMENSLKKYVHKANNYFDVYTSNGQNYKNEHSFFHNRENDKKINSNNNSLSLHFYSSQVGKSYQRLFHYIDEKKYPFFWGKNSNGIDLSLFLGSKSYIFDKYLSKEDTVLLIDKLTSLKNNNKILPDIGTKFSVEDFKNTDLFKYFTLINPKIVSFHEKFYKNDKNGKKIVDVFEIEKMFDFDCWYNGFNSENQIFIPSSIHYDGDDRAFALMNGSTHIYDGSKLKIMWQYSDDEMQKFKEKGQFDISQINEGDDPRFTKKEAIKAFIDYCETHKDFEAKSAKHSSVFQFRGMDQKYVILTGFREITEKSLQSLYIGMSRAKAKLIVLAHKSLEEKIRVKLHEK